MLKRARSSLIVIAVLSVLTFVVVAGTLISAQRQVNVIVASQSLEVGTRLSEQDVALQAVHTADVLPGAYTKVEEVTGQTLTVQRLAGDQITGDMVGTSAMNALASSLPENERAIAIHVNRAQGLAGLLRPGDKVSVISIADSQKLGNSNFGFDNSNSSQSNTFPLQGPMAKLTLSGLRVLFVPWEFRYQEVTPSKDKNDIMSTVMTSRQQQDNGVVILAAPVTPVTVTWKIATMPISGTTGTEAISDTTSTEAISDTTSTEAISGTTGIKRNPQFRGRRNVEVQPFPKMMISPIELLALLDDTDAEIHLVLDPTEKKTTVDTVGVTLENLINKQEQADYDNQSQAQP